MRLSFLPGIILVKAILQRHAAVKKKAPGKTGGFRINIFCANATSKTVQCTVFRERSVAQEVRKCRFFAKRKGP